MRGDSIPRGDLQGAVGAIVDRMMKEKKTLIVDEEVFTKQFSTVMTALTEMNSTDAFSFQEFLNRMVYLGLIKQTWV